MHCERIVATGFFKPGLNAVYTRRKACLIPHPTCRYLDTLVERTGSPSHSQDIRQDIAVLLTPPLSLRPWSTAELEG